MGQRVIKTTGITLDETIALDCNIEPHFSDKLAENNMMLKRQSVSTVQVNIGKRCNQALKQALIEQKT